jgi:hypothetical protein
MAWKRERKTKKKKRKRKCFEVELAVISSAFDWL